MTTDPRHDAQRLWDLWAPHYDTEITADPGPVAEFLAAHAGTGPALELGIGTGRVAIPLARRGVPVDGIDISPAMRDQLYANAADLPIRVFLGDMAEVAVDRQYPLVYVIYSTLAMLLTQDEQIRCLTGVTKALQPGGLLVVEATVPLAGGMLAGRQQLAIRGIGDDHLRLSATMNDPSTQIVQYQEVHLSAAGIRTLPVTTRYFWPSELDLMARLSGLEVAERYGTWDRQPFGPASRSHIALYRNP
jgi:SAM-dependent methyltransferase